MIPDALVPYYGPTWHKIVCATWEHVPLYATEWHPTRTRATVELMASGFEPSAECPRVIPEVAYGGMN